VLVGAIYGLFVVLNSSAARSERWAVWACLAISLTAASGAVFGYGLSRWAVIGGLGGVRRSRIAAYVGRIAAAAVLMETVGATVSAVIGRSPAGRQDGDLIGLLLVAFAAVGALPVIAGLGGVRERALDLAGDDGQRAEAILELRRLLSGLLNALGVLVALATLALGAGLTLGAERETSEVVVFGAGLSVVVGLAYAPATRALSDAARDVARSVVPVKDVTRADLPAMLDQRLRLEQALGADRGLLAELMSGIVILAPLIAGAAATWLRGNSN
jgi:hypothetical protein